MAFITCSSLTLHHTIKGPPGADTLIFINSLGSDWRIWDKVANAFVNSHRVLRYDKRGHGLSDAPSGDYTMRDHAADLLALMDALKLKTATLIGISVGGMIAQAFALWQPDRVSGLVLCDTGARIGTHQSWADRIAALGQGGIESIADAVLARWFTPAFDGAARAGWRNMLLRTPLAGYSGTCAALRDCDLRDAVQAIAVPTLVLCGDQDTSTSPDLNRDLAARIPGAQFVLIAGAAHLPCLEQPAAVIAAITTWQATQRAPGVHAAGMRVRRAVLGDAHVDRAEAGTTSFDADFQRFITETAWGGVWTRPALDWRTKHLITLALIAAGGHAHEFAMHVRAMRNTGATADDLKEVLMHVAVYAGVPAANAAFGIAKKVFAEG